ncbi:MAG: hypothetical protein ATN33_03975 [Epulopiscium sp. Nele67-Bin001]|nr:MAG: hypothetical protein ATN33_03975 [Epulopiscium sp. Nele67-Bin001]
MYPGNEDEFHNVDNRITLSISENLDTNIKNIEKLFSNCADLIKREVDIGEKCPIKIYGVYVDGLVNRTIIESFFLSRIVDYKNLGDDETDVNGVSPTKLIMSHFSATFDIKEVRNMDDMVRGILSGDAAIFVENTNVGLMISCRGWPGRGISSPETEKVIRGPKEGFVETIRFNTVLIRRRIRDTKLKVEMVSMGNRSRTDIAIMYIEDIVKPRVVDDIKSKLDKYEIDGVFDSGYVEQLIEDSWKSPFPQTQATERPDKVAASLMEGKVAVVVDTSPFVLILPTTLNSFFQASEDYYQRWEIMSFTRILRYFVSFLAFALPGLYLAVLNFHPAMLPTTLAVSIASSREGLVIFSVLEIILMEIAFELLKEAGLRLPGPIGHAIGVVGGIVIGNSAVDAKLISPMVVIIVALTAIATFAIPDYSLTTAFRLVKYGFIMVCATFGLYGFFLGIMLMLAHLASLESFGTPYLAPYVSSEDRASNGLRDTVIRYPLFMQARRPRQAMADQKTRIRLKNSSSITQTPPGPDSRPNQKGIRK